MKQPCHRCKVDVTSWDIEAWFASPYCQPCKDVLLLEKEIKELEQELKQPIVIYG